MLAPPNDAPLLDELANVRLRETSPGVALDHDPDKHDDRAVALGMAAHWLLEHCQRRGPRMRYPVDHPPPDPEIPEAPGLPRRLDPTVVQT